MSIDVSELDAMQNAYKEAMKAWTIAIREEEALAMGNHDVADVDRWEHADDREEAARSKVKAAKKTYEAALREKFFNF
jgi:hypothetical protein